MIRFRMYDVLTGAPVGDLHPTGWELTNPLTGVGEASLTVSLPTNEGGREFLRQTIGQHDRVQVGVWDETVCLFGGPVPRPALFDPTQGTLTVKVADWRSWFYDAVLRQGPSLLNANGDFLREQVEQATIVRDLASVAVTASGTTREVGAPAFAVDELPATDVLRDATFRMFESVGDCLDELSRRERGIEWWTDLDEDPHTAVVVPRVRFAYPERATRTDPLRIESVVRIEDRGSRGSNVAERVAWPEQPERRTRVYATGEGTHPDQVWAVDEDPALADGGVLLREAVAGPFTGVKKKATAFEHAYAQRSVLNAAAPVELRLRTDRADLAPSQYDVGDRVDLYLEDQWQRREADNARILQRKLSYSRTEGMVAELVIDVAGTEAVEE